MEVADTFDKIIKVGQQIVSRLAKLHKKRKSMNCLNSYSFLVQMAGIEPARFIQPQDFKSCASASSATSAFLTGKNDYTTLLYQLSIFFLNFFNSIFVFFCYLWSMSFSCLFPIFGIYLFSSNFLIRRINCAKLFLCKNFSGVL